jgi:hypothetical protein
MASKKGMALAHLEHKATGSQGTVSGPLLTSSIAAAHRALQPLLPRIFGFV